MARGSFWGRVRKGIKAFTEAVRRPDTFAPPPLPTTPPEPAPPEIDVRRDREVSRPPAPQRSRFIPRSELPRDWGRNKSALWSDATKTNNAIGYDADAQALYDAALYSFDEDPENRAAILKNFKDYIRDTYGIEWDQIFDWEDYRANYDEAGGRGTYAHGGVLHT